MHTGRTSSSAVERPSGLSHPADLVVGIMSPGGKARDSVDTVRANDAGGGDQVSIIDPMDGRVRLPTPARRGRHEAERTDGRLAITVLKGSWLEASWLRPSPTSGVRRVCDGWSAE